jgi:hypothetical protein
MLRIIAESAADWQEVDRMLTAIGLFLAALQSTLEERQPGAVAPPASALVLQLVRPELPREEAGGAGCENR